VLKAARMKNQERLISALKAYEVAAYLLDSYNEKIAGWHGEDLPV
jgi:hypothetical protein